MLRKLALVVISCLAFPVAAHAVDTDSYGPRFGFSLDPEQIVLGGQMSFANVAPSISFDPNLELGFGDDITLIGVGLDFHYHVNLNDTDWKPYVGFGMAINFVSVDLPPPFDDDSDTEVGGNFILGAEVPTRSNSHFFGEMKLGLGDVPSLKILAGWNFRR